jgi:dynein light intermediate chain, axonemal
MKNPSQATSSLVKYDTPILVSTSGKGKKKAMQLGVEKGSRTRTEEYLNSILPPREFTQDSQLWVQYVSATPATRVDVINLQEELDKKLQMRQARETGICPMREELYSQCFDELIRQIAIQCLERGFLLVRVRDEIRMTIEAYQALYESSIAFGMRKALQAEQRKAEMNMKIKQLDGDCNELQRKVERLEREIYEMEKNEEEERDRSERAHKEQVETLKNTNTQLKEGLQQLLSTPKK